MDHEDETAAGDPACWLALVCEECGAIHEGAEDTAHAHGRERDGG